MQYYVYNNGLECVILFSTVTHHIFIDYMQWVMGGHYVCNLIIDDITVMLKIIIVTVNWPFDNITHGEKLLGREDAAERRVTCFAPAVGPLTDRRRLRELNVLRSWLIARCPPLWPSSHRVARLICHQAGSKSILNPHKPCKWTMRRRNVPEYTVIWL